MLIILEAISYLSVWSMGGLIALGIGGAFDKFDDFSYVNPN